MNCQRCQSEGAEQMFLALGRTDGLEEGVHVADVEAPLCPSCVEWLEDAMLQLMGYPVPEDVEEGV